MNMYVYVHINLTYMQTSRLTRQAWRDVCSNRAKAQIQAIDGVHAVSVTSECKQRRKANVIF
jgi:hypothetical protein